MSTQRDIKRYSDNHAANEDFKRRFPNVTVWDGNGQREPLPNGGVDFYGRCLLCGQKVVSTGGCLCRSWYQIVHGKPST